MKQQTEQKSISQWIKYLKEKNKNEKPSLAPDQMRGWYTYQRKLAMLSEHQEYINNKMDGENIFRQIRQGIRELDAIKNDVLTYKF